MQYFFILGRESELCLAELEAKLRQLKINYKQIAQQKDFVVFDLEKEVDSTDLIRKLGGTIKIGKVSKAKNYKVESLMELLPQTDEKIFFGISCYGYKFNANKLGLEIKKILKQNNHSVRFVTGKENPLSSVIVQKNKLLTENGAELVIFKTEQSAINNQQSTIFIGKTEAVQLFELYGKLDFGRPKHDAYSGMLPPKLATMMINLAGADLNKVLYDPFCGSGTILQQALFLGYKKIIGSDKNAKAVAHSKENVEWGRKELREIAQNYAKLKIFQADISEIAKKLTSYKLTPAFIVTEPYLGPPIKGTESTKQILHIINELEKLYKKSFRAFDQLLKKGTIVIVIPEFKIKGKTHSLGLKKLLPKKMQISDQWQYSRPDQHITRKIVKIEVA